MFAVYSEKNAREEQRAESREREEQRAVCNKKS
jgi:hypothetical protein